MVRNRGERVAGDEEESEVGGFDLLDGQQRVRTMLLAVADPVKEGRCLWIDPKGDDEDRVLALRLTTASQPFGYDRNGSKLPLPERGRARVEFDRDEPDYPKADYQIFQEHISRRGVPPKPYNHPLAIPFKEVFETWRRDRSVLGDFIRNRIGDDLTVDCRQVLEHIEQGFCAFDGAEIALILVRTDLNELLRLFDRIGAGGTPLSGEERLYSIYKHHEPYVYNAIGAIHELVGRVLPATKIAGCAMRIASIETIKTANDSFDIPDVVQFAKRMAGDTDLKRKLRNLIPDDGNWKFGHLARTFSTLFRALNYTGGDDFGLPRVMVPELAPELVHVLAYWVYLHTLEASDITPASRQQMVRFALFWRLCCFNDTKASRHALKFLKDTGNVSPKTDFPGKVLYRLLTGMTGQDRCADNLSLPKDMRAYSNSARDGKLKPGWLSWKDRF